MPDKFKVGDRCVYRGTTPRHETEKDGESCRIVPNLVRGLNPTEETWYIVVFDDTKHMRAAREDELTLLS